MGKTGNVENEKTLSDHFLEVLCPTERKVYIYSILKDSNLLLLAKIVHE